MPADRVTEAAPAPSEQDLRDALIAAVNGHRISPDLAWAIIGRWDRADPPVAVPGPASEPADPVVSPADTIRRARNRIAARGQHDLVGLADLADALLAVGERDRRERDLYKRQLDAVDKNLPWEDEPGGIGVVGRIQAILNLKADRERGDRDRRQIARLNARIEAVSGNVYLWQIGELDDTAALKAIIADDAAVLADEEDARR